MSIREDAQGNWMEILLAVGIDRSFLRNTHGPCPACGGKDRFRWDNHHQKGGFICNHCGAGDGFKLAELCGIGFRQVCDIIRGLGISTDQTGVQRIGGEEDHRLRERMQSIWMNAKALKRGSPTDKYLTRRLGTFLNLSRVRYVKECFDIWHPFDQKRYPAAMVCKIAHEGRAVNLHMTYLDNDGLRIETEKPKLVMAGKLPAGCAIQLAEHGDHLGIAEGVETALACQMLTGIPTWAAINATLLSQWVPPAGVKKVTVFGDNDLSYTGQAKAYCLANRLLVKDKLSVSVQLPETDGADWADIVAAGAR